MIWLSELAGEGGGIPVTGPLTDAQLRAAPVPVSMSSDVEIGAVELKDGATDTRATVTAGNALKVDGSAVTHPVEITDGAGIVNTKQIGNQLTAADIGLIVQTVIHGLSSAGGGTYVDVKVNPSGALTVEADVTNTVGLTDAELRATPVPVSGSMTSSPAYNISVDAGFRHRVSQMRTLLDLKTLVADDPLLLENTGTGTGSWTNNTYQMSVASGQYLIRRSKQYVHYFSGKSQFVELTFDDFHTQENVTKRIGYFSSNAVAPYDSDKDGIWLEDNGTTKRLVVSNFGTETHAVNMADWDNAAIAQGYDWSKFTVIVFDFLWLGGATLRMFLKTDAGFVLLHTLAQAGNGDGPFTRSPNQSVRYEIRSTTGTGTLHYICSQVATEGSTDENGKSLCTPIQSTGIVFGVVGTTYLFKAVRKRSGYRDKVFQVLDFEAFVTSLNDQAIVSLHLNPTLSAAPTYTAIANTCVEAADGNGTITLTAPGHTIWAQTIVQNSLFPSRFLVEDFLAQPGVSIADVMDQIVIALTPLTTTITAHAHIRMKEF